MSMRKALLCASIVLSAVAMPAVAQPRPPQPPHVSVNVPMPPPPPHIVVVEEPRHVSGPAPKRLQKGKGKGWAKGHK